MLVVSEDNSVQAASFSQTSKKLAKEDELAIERTRAEARAAYAFAPRDASLAVP